MAITMELAQRLKTYGQDHVLKVRALPLDDPEAYAAD